MSLWEAVELHVCGHLKEDPAKDASRDKQPQLDSDAGMRNLLSDVADIIESEAGTKWLGGLGLIIIGSAAFHYSLRV